MIKENNILYQLQEKFFDSLVSNRLIYNTCWEDPRMDRQLLNLDSKSEIVMLTSAGCNALDYLLDQPKGIHCVDANPAQNALLDLKKALFLSGNYHRLWNFLGKGHDGGADLFYDRRLSNYLLAESQQFWNHHINYFSKTPAEGSFYFRGTSGKIARMMHRRIKRKGLYGSVLDLLDSETLEEQAYHFEEVEGQLWNTFYKWLIRQNTTMALLGVPAVQRNMIEEYHEGGLFSFIQEALRNVFTKLPVKDNYFWRVYLTGSYTRSCCPNYLKREYFELLRNQVSKIRLHTSNLTNFLRKNPGSYSHFVLLDHQDWLARNDSGVLDEEWAFILENARPGAKILFRSAGASFSFLPKFVLEYLRFHTDKTKRLHARDRVGTYGRTFLAEVEV